MFHMILTLIAETFKTWWKLVVVKIHTSELTQLKFQFEDLTTVYALANLK